MKKGFLLILLGFITSNSFSQTNLVYNPSFEMYDTCPDYLSQISRAIGWYSSKNTPDYFNSCSTDTLPSGVTIVSSPINGFGYRTPSSGNSYSGIAAGISGSGSKEYLGTQLITTLQISNKYYFSFKVSLAGEANPGNRCGINKLGALFSTLKYSSIFNAPVCNCAQIVSDSIITDTLNWTRIAGSFIADSSYSYINIGRFADDTSTNSIQIIGTACIAYYYIDDVCISTDSVYTYNYVYTGMNDGNKDESLFCFPNPTTDFLNVQDSETSILGLRLYTTQGQLIKSWSIDGTRTYTVNIGNLPKGIYFLSILRKNKNQIFKLIIKQ